MKVFQAICGFALFAALCGSLGATGWRKESTDLLTINARLCGQVLDYTANHGKDRRLWSPALGQRRDVYVYLPPHFDPRLQYPLMMWFHGFAQDEGDFLKLVAPPAR